MKLLLSSVLLGLMVLTACNTKDCQSNHTDLFTVNFRDYRTNESWERTYYGVDQYGTARADFSDTCGKVGAFESSPGQCYGWNMTHGAAYPTYNEVIFHEYCTKRSVPGQEM